MPETYTRSSGSLETYENGHKVQDMQYNTESDGDVVDFYVKDKDNKYYGQTNLNEDSRLALLNYPSSDMLLFDALEKDFFPLKATKITKSNSKKRRHSKRSTKKK